MDVASNVVLEAVQLYSRADNGTSTSDDSSEQRPAIYKVVGIILAVCSGLFIGVSFVIKKIGLLKANVKYNEEAGEGYGYLKNAWWWTGMTLMIIGEVCNFAAYMFVDAILVTPLGALSVVVTTILSAIFLKERLSFVGKVSCFLCIVGSVIIVLNAPEQSAVANIQQMQHFVIAPGFLSYAGVMIVGCAFVALWCGPRYGKKTMLVYLTVCSLIGGLSVVATQGLGSAILAQINGQAQFNKWFTYVLLVFVIATLLTEIVYLNKALNIFNAALVTPTYYVYFTSSTIVASAVLFQGFHGTALSITTVVMGFLVICTGVVLLQLAKSSKDVPDTAVFKGEFDQVRTMAEQEEPEYEPRADTIRGGASIVRAMSRVRTKREAGEAQRIHEERMEPIGEGEQMEWDGLRRRKTVSTAASGSISRRKTVHPPLGMTHFPNDDDNVSEADSEVHPGFFGRIGRKATMSRSQRKARTDPSPVPMGTVSVNPDKPDEEHVYGLPPGLHRDPDHEDTSYRSPGQTTDGAHLRWAGDDNDSQRDRASSRGASSLAPPRPPIHTTGPTGGAKRQFSFTNVFSRNKSNASDSEAPESSFRPASRGALSFVDRRAAANKSREGVVTEEERLGLVHGDSNKQLPRYDEVPEFEDRDSDEWQVTDGRGSSSSPEVLGGSGDLGRPTRRSGRGGYGDYDEDEDLGDGVLRSPESERVGGRGGAFV